jgi:drug/metabolite transporter, DME family
MLSTTTTRHGFWLVTGAAILWGTIGIAIQGIYDLETTSSLFINLARNLIATPVFLLAGWRILGARMFDFNMRSGLIMILNGSLLALSHAAYFAAIRAAGVTITTLLTICLAPIVVSGLSFVLRQERYTARTGWALLLALMGSALLVGFHESGGTQYTDLGLGVAYSVAAAFCYGSMIVCGRFLAGASHPLQVNAISFSAGTVVLLVLNLIVGLSPIQTEPGWLLTLYLGLVPTALAYGMLQIGLRVIPATTASIIGMLDPLVAALLAWLLFDERLSLIGIGGAVLLLSSLFVLSLRQPTAD